ncbi:MAG: hypothetical protein AB7O96_03680 [Pseudobdellovibrionaceae bacterium]
MLNKVVLVMALLFAQTTLASELEYFNSGIDFWGTQSPPQKPNVQPENRISDEKNTFPWKTYLDPKNKEFFKEGDYTPPEPFMEVAKNPSDENLKNWFEFMRRKNELAAHLETRMQEYLAKNQAQPPLTPLAAAPVAKSVAKAAVPIDPSRFRIRMYFDSHCLHCRRMFGVLKRLQDAGYKIEALQVDNDRVPVEESGVPIGKVNLSELKNHGGSAVPYLVIADLKRKALLPGIQGYHDFEEVMALLREASRG